MNKLEAFKKLEKYHYLINTPLSKSDGGFPITDIVVIPRDTEYWESFFNHYIASKRNEVALAVCGYKGDDFTILLLHYNGYNNFHVHSEINKFLQKNN